MEYAAEKETFRKQTEEMGLQRKVKRGDAWYPLKMGKSYFNSLNQLVVEVFRQGDEEIEHNFEFGRPVAFFRVDGKDKIKYFNFTGTVSYVAGDRMVVAVPDNGQLIDVQSAENVGVQLFFDETSYKMMFDALDRVIRGKGRLGYLRDLFYSHQKAETYTFSSMHFPYLNRTQEEAVNKVLWAKDVAVVHGPPGTGKTTTLVEAIYETLIWLSIGFPRSWWIVVSMCSALAIPLVSMTRCSPSPMSVVSRIILTTNSSGASARPFATCAVIANGATRNIIRNWND